MEDKLPRSRLVKDILVEFLVNLRLQIMNITATALGMYRYYIYIGIYIYGKSPDRLCHEAVNRLHMCSKPRFIMSKQT